MIADMNAANGQFMVDALKDRVVFAETNVTETESVQKAIDTPLMAMASAEVRDGITANIPFPKRLGKAPEFAALARHIVENAYLNGETIRLDGAVRMPPR